MSQPHDLRTTRRSLLSDRELRVADGRQLSAYRFTRREYDIMKSALAAHGARALQDWDGRILFVAFVAEWFRREREGGQWDWIRPCAEIRITYTGERPDVNHTVIREAVSAGLRGWNRPLPDDDDTGHKWIMAMVRECGFPAADLQRGGRLQAWLASALALVERGFDVDHAVEREAWRVSDQLVSATIDTAKAFCAELAHLRGRLRASEVARLGVDAISYLDAADPTWRNRLPIVAEDRHAASLIEDLVRADDPSAALLAVTRVLQKIEGVWHSAARVALEGSASQDELPLALKSIATDRTRFTIRPRGVGASVHSGVVASLEREVGSEAEVSWRLQKRIGKFEPRCRLTDDISFGVEANGATLTEFVPEGGESVPEGLVAFRLGLAPDPGDVATLTFLSAASARVRDMWLALAGPIDLMERLEVEGEWRDLGAVSGQDLVVTAICGVARLKREHSSFTWRTACGDEDADNLCFDGVFFPLVRETVFKGPPRPVLLRNGARSPRRLERLHWRPAGRGDWRTPGLPIPPGRVELAIVENDEILARRTISIAPSELEITPSETAGRRLLSIKGMQGAEVAALHRIGEAARALPSARDGEGVTIDLEELGAGEALQLNFAWPETDLYITMRDPTTATALVKPDGTVERHRARLSIEGLLGWRIFAAEQTLLHVSLRRTGGGRAVGTSLLITGEIPLVAFQDEIKSVLSTDGDDGALDAVVRLEWVGRTQRIAEIGWYEAGHREESPNGDDVISIVRPDKPAARAMGTQRADDLVALGGGPFVVLSKRGDRSWRRPRLLNAEPLDRRGLSLLQEATALADRHERQEAIAARLARARDLSVQELSFIRATLGAARDRVPLVTFDLLRGLCPDHDAAVWCLAFAEDLEQRSCVLSIEDELPFVWGATRLESWTEAFDARARHLTDKLKLVGAGDQLATEVLCRALTEITNHVPSLAGHASWVARRWLNANPPAELVSLARRLHPASATEPIRQSTDALVIRRAERTYWPQLAIANLLGEESRAIAYEDYCRDIVAAPHVAAMIALGKIPRTIERVHACREARMFDQEYFDDILPRALLLRARGFTWFTKGRAS